MCLEASVEVTMRRTGGRANGAARLGATSQPVSNGLPRWAGPLSPCILIESVQLVLVRRAEALLREMPASRDCGYGRLCHVRGDLKRAAQNRSVV